MTAKVSIGMPLYNAERYLERALEALLVQTFTDFELIISDNASTDKTWELCQDYAAKDARIKLYRNASNLGAIANFAHVLNLASSSYFMWAAHDDFWEPNFIADCVASLEANPDAILCFVRHLAFDDQTGTISPINYPKDVQSAIPWQRLNSLLLCWPLPNVIIYGLFRTDLLKSANALVFEAGAPDTLVLMKALLAGTFVMVDRPLHTYTVSHRNIKHRIKQLQLQGENSNWILLRTDVKLFRSLMQIANQATPELKIRLVLFKSVMIFMYRIAGWPISFKLLSRHLSLLLPDEWLNKLRLSKNKH
jgi:glycosyltransferase involved in cell wall biosynthesis